MGSGEEYLYLLNSMGWKMPMPKDPLKGIDTESEMELIRQKKSKLSSAKRKMVMKVLGLDDKCQIKNKMNI